MPAFEWLTVHVISCAPEQPSDRDAIWSVTEAAFQGKAYADGTEAGIPTALRDAGAIEVSLIAEVGEDVVAHICFSAVRVGGRDVGWHGLGPLSVHPDFQRQGVGTALVQAGLRAIKEAGSQGCVLTGDPGYYSRFGFKTDPRLSYSGAPAPYFQVLAFGGEVPMGEVTFHAAFGEG